MKRGIVLALAVWWGSGLALSQELPSVDRIRVEASVAAVADIVRKVGGERVEASILVPPETDPLAFEPSLEEVARINAAQVFFYTGEAQEPWVGRLLPGITNQNLLIVDGSQGALSGEKLADQVADALATVDHQGRSFYFANADSYKAGLHERALAIQDPDR